MNSKYGLNICGEGGEYETFTLDCPLFVKKLVVCESEIKMHSDDAFAPVAFLQLKKLKLEDKPNISNLNFYVLLLILSKMERRRMNRHVKRLKMTAWKKVKLKFQTAMDGSC